MTELRRLAVLRRQLRSSESVPLQLPGSVQTHSSGLITVQWSGYHTMCCYWGTVAGRLDQRLFLGFADGAANIMMVPDPTAQRSRSVGMDAFL